MFLRVGPVRLELNLRLLSINAESRFDGVGAIPQIRLELGSSLIERYCMSECTNDCIGGGERQSTRYKSDGVDGIPR